MSSKKKLFADDGWAIWVDGNDSSTVYINDWINPKGKSYIDIAVRVRGIKNSSSLNVYVPFFVTKEEIVDVSLLFHEKNILQATFSSICLVDYKKNEHTSEIAYNGKTIDIVHIDTLNYIIKDISRGTVISFNIDELKPFLDNDEAYFIWRMPHKSLDTIFKPKVHVRGILERFRDLVTTPVIFEKYGYSIRINESRLLPEEINKIGSFHRQKLKKAVVTISIDERYEINDLGCYRIRHLEENLYKEYLPSEYNSENVITYQWTQTRENNMFGQFNFYLNIARESISQSSMVLYIVILLAVGIICDILSGIVKVLVERFF